MTLFEQLKELEQKNRAKGNVEVADRLLKMIGDTPVKIGCLPVVDDEED